MSEPASSIPRDRYSPAHRQSAAGLLSPLILLLAVFLLYPLVRSLWLSFETTSGPHNRRFIGLGNYRFLLADRLFWYALLNTFIFTFAFLIVEIPLSLGLAVLLNHKRIWWRGPLRLAFFSTYLVGQVFVAVVFARLLTPRAGPVHAVLSAVLGRSIEIPWLSDPIWCRFAILLAMWWLATGLGVVYLSAALQAVDPQLHDAAAIDGAGPWRRFVHVTLPSLRQVLMFLSIVGAIGGLQLFELPYVLLQGPGPRAGGLTVVMYLFATGFEAGNLGYASAIGWTVCVMCAGVIWVLVVVRKLLSSPSPGTPGEGRGEGHFERRTVFDKRNHPHPNPLPAYTFGKLRAGRERGPYLRIVSGLVLNISLLVIAAGFAFPFLWMAFTAFRSGNTFSLIHFQNLLSHQPVSRWLVNSLFIASTQSVLVVLISSLAGFALAKYQFRGRRVLIALFLGSLLLPGPVLLPASYELMVTLGWTNTYAALILPGCASGFGALLFRSAMANVPDELLDAARVDGMSELNIWWAIALPLVRPMLAAQLLLSFTAAWNSFLWPQVILQTEAKYTLPLALANLAALQGSDAGALMAATLVGVVPVLILFLSMQREFIAGLTDGATKG